MLRRKAQLGIAKEKEIPSVVEKSDARGVKKRPKRESNPSVQGQKPQLVISKDKELPFNVERSGAKSGKKRSKRESISPTLFLKIFLVVGCLLLLPKLLSTQQPNEPVPMSTHQFSEEGKKSEIKGIDTSDQEVKRDDDNENIVMDHISPSPEPTGLQDNALALLYPPGLVGGYRNQVIRLLSLAMTAIKRKIPSLLLPSLLWSTQIVINGKETWVPIPHDLIFDVEYWNSFSGNLPNLVEATDSMDCWTTHLPTKPDLSHLMNEVIQRGFLTPIANLSYDIVARKFVPTNLRRLDVLGNVSHCKNPHAYGGGIAVGRLWRDYATMNEKKTDLQGADTDILKALQPKQQWKDLAHSCITDRIDSEKNYIALHARIELEMMNHRCGKNMERNLTHLFDNVQLLIENELREDTVGGVFVAVSRAGIELNEGQWYESVKTYADENLATFNRVVGDNLGGSIGEGLGGGQTIVFECGEKLMDKYYKQNPNTIDYGSLLQSVVNFYVATEAKAFVGVRGSSYSTDIWTTRYHQGKGDRNYEYTRKGIILMENGGLPPKHTDCKHRKDV